MCVRASILGSLREIALARSYTPEQLKLIWSALKKGGSALKAEETLRNEHDFNISRVTILRYLREGMLDEFDPKEAERLRNETRGRQGVRHGRQRKSVARAPVVPAHTSERANDEVRLGTFMAERFGLDPTSLTGSCLYPKDLPSGRTASCGGHTVFELFKRKLPREFQFGTLCTSYCLVHVYASLSLDGRRRLMDAVSSFSLTHVA